MPGHYGKKKEAFDKETKNFASFIKKKNQKS